MNNPLVSISQFYYSIRCIDVADEKAEGLHHVELTYDPIRFNAVACNNTGIFVVDSAPGGGVHIHTWSGQHTHSLSHGQLGLRDHDWIWAVDCDDDYILQLAVGDYCSETVHSLHAYEVNDFQAEVALHILT